MSVPARPFSHDVQRHALLVLGMHRSGTSALTGLFVHLGATPPKALMPANGNNPQGYWESSALCGFHDRLLESVGTRWDAWTRVNVNAFDAELASECRSLIEQEFDGASLFAIKDPRICRFVPFWLANLETDAIGAVPILIVRNPYEVARSLQLASGIGTSQSLLLWLRHVLDSEIATRPLKRSIVAHKDLLTDSRAVIERISCDVDIRWPNAELTNQEITHVVNRDLHDHRLAIPPPEGVPRLREWLTDTYHAFGGLCAGALAPAVAYATFDGIRSEFDSLTDVFGASLEAEMTKCRTLVKAEQEHLVDRVSEIEAERNRLVDRLSRAEADRERLRHETEELKAHSRSAGHQLSEVERENQRLAQELQATRERVSAILESASWRVTAPLRVTAGFLRPKRREEGRKSR